MTGSRWFEAVRGPLAPYGPGFESQLVGRGFGPSAVQQRLWLLDHVSRWLQEEQLVAGELTPERVEQFLARHGRVVTTPSPPPPPCAMPASFAQALRRSSAFA